MASSSIFSPKTPGVYLTELDAFPQAIVGVPTAVPAFIGYTEEAQTNGRSVLGKPVQISSMAEYEEHFGGPPHPQYVYSIERRDSLTGKSGNQDEDDNEGATAKEDTLRPDLTLTVGNDNVVRQTYYYFASLPKNQRKYYTYYGVKMFFANGGGTCYIVSVGNYESDVVWEGSTSREGEKGKKTACDLSRGLDAIGNQAGPTMLVMPEAVDLVEDNYKAAVKAMMDQAVRLQDRVVLLDVPGADGVTQENVTPQKLEDAIKPLMEALGTIEKLPKSLSYGMAYFPWLNTTAVAASDLDYTNFDDASENAATAPVSKPAPPGLTRPSQLQGILGILNMQENLPLNYKDGDPTNPSYDAVLDVINRLSSKDDPKTSSINNDLLMSALPRYAQLLSVIAKKASVVPASPIMAGVFTLNDANNGVWNAPANMALAAVRSPTVNLTDGLQAPLNVPVDGRAVNVIRYFPGRGTVVWGARTLEGNSLDWRYIQVRRAIIYIEQSIKQAINQYVFAPNTAQTWVAVTQMVSGFLQDLWASGGLMGAKASEAFSVQCGVPTTMTGRDVLNGIMVVQVTLQMVHPAEFIQLQFKQTMQGV